MKRTVLFLLLLLCMGWLNAQMITGVWRGSITKGSGLFAKSMKLEVKLIKKGDSLVGTSYYYINSKIYMRYSVRGYFDAASNAVHWEDHAYLLSKPEKTAQSPDVRPDPMKSVADFNCPNPNAVMKLDGMSTLGEDQIFDTHLTKVPRSFFPDEWDDVIDGYTAGMADPHVIDSVWAIASVPENPLIAKARKAEEEKARQEELAKAKAEEKARQEEIAKSKAEAEEKAKQEEIAKAKAVAEEKARQEEVAKAKAKAEAEEKVRQEEIAKAKVEAEEKAKQEEIAKAKAVAEEKARQEEVAKAKAKAEAEEKVRQEEVAKAKAKAEAEEKVRQEEIAKAKVEAEEKAKQEEIARAKAVAEEKARQEEVAKAKAKAEAEEKARQEEIAKAKAEAEEKAKQEEVAKAKVRAEEKARQDAIVKARAVQEKALEEAKAKAKAEQEERARQTAVAKAKETEEENSKPAAANPDGLKPAIGAVVASSQKPSNNPLPTIQDPDAIKKFTARKKIQQGEIPMDGDSIELHFYDNAEVDGDSISLFVNGRLMFNHVKLTSQPYIFKLPVKELPDNSEMAMLAENLGAIPPNTALMLAFIKGERYSIRLESTESSTGTVKLVRRE